jgi:hypothetical protein
VLQLPADLPTPTKVQGQEEPLALSSIGIDSSPLTKQNITRACLRGPSGDQGHEAFYADFTIGDNIRSALVYMESAAYLINIDSVERWRDKAPRTDGTGMPNSN